MCWSPGTVCATVVQCSDNSYQACVDKNRRVDCDTKTCVAAKVRAKGACIEEISGPPSCDYTCCPDVTREECLAGEGTEALVPGSGRMRSFVPDVGIDFCQSHGFMQSCGACCHKKMC